MPLLYMGVTPLVSHLYTLFVPLKLSKLFLCMSQKYCQTFFIEYENDFSFDTLE